MDNEYTLEELEEIMDEGYCMVTCTCGESHVLEPDGYMECACGERVESPLLVLGLI